MRPESVLRLAELSLLIHLNGSKLCFSTKLKGITAVDDCPERGGMICQCCIERHLKGLSSVVLIFRVSFDDGLHSMPKEVNKSPEDKRYHPTNVSKSFNI